MSRTNYQLKSIVERIERLDEEKRALAEDIKEIYTEAKGNGFDAKYLSAVGFDSTPLGRGSV